MSKCIDNNIFLSQKKINDILYTKYVKLNEILIYMHKSKMSFIMK